MRQHLAAVVFLSVLLTGAGAPAESSWVFQPSTYSHDPQSGERVTQYAIKAPAYAPSDATYQRSGYVHNRTALRGAGGSIERRHYVETWGAGEAIRPYGEWEFPFRAGATPFGPWGNPSGPWTMPFDSWINPYGLGNLYNYSPYWRQTPWYPPPRESGTWEREGAPHDRRSDPGEGGYPDGRPGGRPERPHGGQSNRDGDDRGGQPSPEGISRQSSGLPRGAAP